MEAFCTAELILLSLEPTFLHVCMEIMQTLSGTLIKPSSRACVHGDHANLERYPCAGTPSPNLMSCAQEWDAPTSNGIILNPKRMKLLFPTSVHA